MTKSSSRCWSHEYNFQPLLCPTCLRIVRQNELEESRDERDKGIARVASNNAEWILEANQAMRQLCHQMHSHKVSAVELQYWAKTNGKWPTHMNAFGPVFRGKEWAWTGELVQCRHKKGHARTVKVWTLASLATGDSNE